MTFRNSFPSVGPYNPRRAIAFRPTRRQISRGGETASAQQPRNAAHQHRGHVAMHAPCDCTRAEQPVDGSTDLFFAARSITDQGPHLGGNRTLDRSRKRVQRKGRRRGVRSMRGRVLRASRQPVGSETTVRRHLRRLGTCSIKVAGVSTTSRRRMHESHRASITTSSGQRINQLRAELQSGGRH